MITDKVYTICSFLVMVRPQVAVSPKHQVVDIAQAVTFRCSASAGFPAPTLRWQRGGSTSLPLFSTFVRGLFKILAASRDDEGEYMCIASNTGGSSVMKVQLLVKGQLPCYVKVHKSNEHFSQFENTWFSKNYL